MRRIGNGLFNLKGSDVTKLKKNHRCPSALFNINHFVYFSHSYTGRASIDNICWPEIGPNAAPHGTKEAVGSNFLIFNIAPLEALEDFNQ